MILIHSKLIQMDNQEKLALIKRNTEEIVTEDELKDILNTIDKPNVYTGYEPSGPVHIGHAVTVMKLKDMEKAGFHVKILLADVHALLNKKGTEEEIAREHADHREPEQQIRSREDDSEERRNEGREPAPDYRPLGGRIAQLLPRVFPGRPERRNRQSHPQGNSRPPGLSGGRGAGLPDPRPQRRDPVRR